MACQTKVNRIFVSFSVTGNPLILDHKDLKTTGVNHEVQEKDLHSTIKGFNPLPQHPRPPNILNIWLTVSQTGDMASQCVLCLSDQPVLWLCGWLGPTGCSGSSLGCPSAPGICPHICFTVDGQGTDPRRASPLTALALMSRTEICQQNANKMLSKKSRR